MPLVSAGQKRGAAVLVPAVEVRLVDRDTVLRVEAASVGIAPACRVGIDRQASGDIGREASFRAAWDTVHPGTEACMAAALEGTASAVAASWADAALPVPAEPLEVPSKEEWLLLASLQSASPVSVSLVRAWAARVRRMKFADGLHESPDAGPPWWPALPQFWPFWLS